ncbi:MAG: enhanced serine sensitivity protein SseB [Clostridiales bacterium]|nr:enhanced serine sensitivity protein SseB [Clostridiales bacterium]
MHFSQEPISNPVLDAALRSVQQNPTEKAQNILFQEIALRARFILPVTVANPSASDGQGNATVAARVTLLTGKDDRHYFPAFTSREEWKKWQASSGQQTAVAQFDDYVDLLDKDSQVAGLVINPFGAALMLSREDVARLKKSKDSFSFPSTMQKMETGTKIRLRDPSEEADDLRRAMADYLKTCPQIQSAYLCIMDKDGEESFLVVLQPNVSDRSVADGLAKASLPYLRNKPLNVASALSEVGERVRMSFSAFYGSK